MTIQWQHQQPEYWGISGCKMVASLDLFYDVEGE